MLSFMGNRRAGKKIESDVGVSHTLHSRGRQYYGQGNYSKAKQHFWEAVQGREKVLGEEHIDTLDSKHWLAQSLFKQEKYPEAEQLFRQAVQGREKVLGAEHINTFDSKHWLARSLYKQEKYPEAEQFLRQAVQGREKVLGAEHQDTNESVSLLQELLLAMPTQILEKNRTGTIALSRLRELFEERQGSSAKYSDLEIGQISSLLSHFNPQWSKVPRTYIILRTVGCLNLLDEFIDLGFSDYWFPVTERNLPYCLHPSHRSEFVAIQDLVLTISIGLKKGEEGQHSHFRRHEPLPFVEKGVLGSGGFGLVDKVLSLISFKEYARKRVLRKQAFDGRGREEMKHFVAEIAILKRLKHRHVVELLGSYTDPKYVGLIMSPVAEMDLSTYLAQADATRYGELRTFFGCLARGLGFLHEQNVRHKDIKPGNILVHGGNILFTDFGLSLDFTNADSSTTISMVNGMTSKYCAPEVAMYEPRNTASDVWSLGIVFLEMAAVLRGKTVEFIYEFFKRHGSKQAFVRTNLTALPKLVAELRESGQASDNRALEWPQQMLRTEQQLRPTAAAVFASITAVRQLADGNGMFCGICCMSLDESSDASNDLSASAQC